MFREDFREASIQQLILKWSRKPFFTFQLQLFYNFVILLKFRQLNIKKSNLSDGLVISRGNFTTGLLIFFLSGLTCNSCNVSHPLNKVDGPLVKRAKVSRIYPSSWHIVGTLQKFLSEWMNRCGSYTQASKQKIHGTFPLIFYVM